MSCAAARSVPRPPARPCSRCSGEFLLPRPEGAWQEALIGSLQLLGFTPSAARQAVVRSAREDWLEGERVGRRSRMRLTARSADLLRDGARRIYGFGGPVAWDGRWLLLVLRVPEPRRELRHRLTTQLAWAGFGSLGGGLWITPHVDREAQVHVEEPAQLLSFRAELGALGGTERVIEEAWDLPALREHYEQFVDDFVRLRPRGGASPSPPRPRWSTRGGASRSSTRTSRTTCSRATGRAGAPSSSSATATTAGLRPPRNTSTRWRLTDASASASTSPTSAARSA